LDIAIFTFTNHKIANVIEEAFKRGIKIRLIADDVCCGIIGSDVYKLAAMVILLLYFNLKNYFPKKL